MMLTKRYSEMIAFESFDERLRYLQLHGEIGAETFGINRYFNQRFYRSPEWQRIRHEVIIRDNGWDLGIQGLDIILSRGIIHHITPITIEDINYGTARLFDMDNLVLCSPETHRAIHYGYPQENRFEYVERKPFDTCPWKR